jgi:catechol 2,3-dioxygenase-like lactoylglutathione lyase family enzyme
MTATADTPTAGDTIVGAAIPSFIKIFVSDLDAATEFYGAAFAFTPAERFSTPQFDEIILVPHTATGPRIVLCRWRDGRALDHGNSRGPIGLRVRDVSAAYGHALARGATSALTPVTYKGMTFAVIRDPDGHSLELIAKAMAA